MVRRPLVLAGVEKLMPGFPSFLVRNGGVLGGFQYSSEPETFFVLTSVDYDASRTIRTPVSRL